MPDTAVVEVARRHVGVLHQSMLVGLLDRPDDGPADPVQDEIHSDVDLRRLVIASP